MARTYTAFNFRNMQAGDTKLVEPGENSTKTLTGLMKAIDRAKRNYKFAATVHPTADGILVTCLDNPGYSPFNPQKLAYAARPLKTKSPKPKNEYQRQAFWRAVFLRALDPSTDFSILKAVEIANASVQAYEAANIGSDQSK